MLCKMEDEGASYGAALKGTVDRPFRTVFNVHVLVILLCCVRCLCRTGKSLLDIFPYLSLSLSLPLSRSLSLSLPLSRSLSLSLSHARSLSIYLSLSLSLSISLSPTSPNSLPLFLSPVLLHPTQRHKPWGSQRLTPLLMWRDMTCRPRSASWLNWPMGESEMDFVFCMCWEVSLSHCVNESISREHLSNDYQSSLSFLFLLSPSLSLSKTMTVDSVPTSGISKVTDVDFAYAKTLGCTIKLIGTASVNSDGTLAVFVSPTMVSHLSTQLSQSLPLFHITFIPSLLIPPTPSSPSRLHPLP
jgi:Homoserine dehydrogenase